MKTEKSVSAVSKKGYFTGRRREGLAFISLWLFGFMFFRLFPYLFSLVCSFSDFKLFGGIRKWGLMNYTEIFSDAKIISSLMVTFRYTLITVPFRLAAALLAAMLLNRKIKGISFFRTVFYIPSVLGSSVAVAILWKTVFRDDGTANAVLSALGMSPVNWLSEQHPALFVISLLRIWQFGSSMVIFLAALKSVPCELYEAAEIDGAGKMKKFTRITLPLLTPVIFYNIVTQFGLAMQEFNAPFIITQGGPRNSTALISMIIYNTAFQMRDMGMACALSWVFFIIITVIISFLFMSQKFWVFYGDETQEDI